MQDKKMKVFFYSGVGSITGANFLLEIPSKNKLIKILVDCGLIQGDYESFLKNRQPFQYEPASIDYLFVTHAHLDHVGRIPKLIKEGFNGQIYSTVETKELARLILEDALTIMQKESAKQGVSAIYERIDLEKAFELWKEIKYHEEVEFEGGWSVNTFDSGHILGSSMFRFTHNGKSIAFTGDLGNSPSTLLKDTEVIPNVDYLVMESVYGDRNHEPKTERKEKLKEAIKSIHEKNGTLLIPAFSLERTQVLLSEMNDLVESGEVPEMPVFVDSPLAIKITEVYRSYKNNFNETSLKKINGGDDIFNFPKLKFTEKSFDSKIIENTPPPKVIIAGSGMSVGGRILRHEKELLPNKNNIFLLVGYQSIGTIGRLIEEGVKEVKIEGEKIKVRAEVRKITGYSAHKDSDHLLEFVANLAGFGNEKDKSMSESKDEESKGNESNIQNFKLKKVFPVMGEIKSSAFLAQKIKDNIGVEAECPEVGRGYEIE